MFFHFSSFISYENFYLLGSYLVNKIFVHTLSSLKKLELGINKFIFSCKKPDHSAEEQAGCH